MNKSPLLLNGLKPNPAWAKLPLFSRKGWARVPFADIVENVHERVEPTDAADEVYVGLEHLDSGCLHVRRSGKGSDVIGTKLRFRRGDVIFGRRRAYQRKLAVAEIDGICSAHAMVVRARPKRVRPEFLPFLMMSDRFMDRAIEISVGSLSPTINWTALKHETFDLPPLNQQAQLADVLWAVDETCTRYTIAVAATETSINAMLANILGDGTTTGGFPVHPLKDVAFLQTGVAKGKRYSPSVQTVELPYLRVANVQDGRLDLTEIKTIKVREGEEDRYKLRVGDVVICEGGDFDKVGRGTIWRGELPTCLHQNHVFCLRTDRSALLPDFLALQLASPYGKRYFLGCAKKTSNLASINSSQVKAFPLQLPDIDTQAAIVNSIGELHTRAGAFASCLSAAQRTLKQLTEAW